MSKVSIEDLGRAGARPQGAADERRRSPRSDLTVRVDYSTIDELFSEFTRDINEGGLFIETEKPSPAGTSVTLHFNLPGGEGAVVATGTVVRVQPGSPGTAPGMGIEFDELDGSARQQINGLIRSLRNDPS